MERERLTKFLAGIVLGLSGTLLLLPEAHSANSASPHAMGNSRRQSPQTRRPTSRRVNRSAPSPSSFTPEMPFEEAIGILRNITVPPLNIAVLWKDLEENADIYRDTPIGIDGVSGVSLRTHLKLLIAGVSAGSAERLGYVVDEGVVIVATQGSLPKKMTARVYDITDLVGAPAGMGSMMVFGGMNFGGAGSYGPMMPFGGAGLQTPVGTTRRTRRIR